MCTVCRWGAEELGRKEFCESTLCRMAFVSVPGNKHIHKTMIPADPVIEWYVSYMISISSDASIPVSYRKKSLNNNTPVSTAGINRPSSPLSSARGSFKPAIPLKTTSSLFVATFPWSADRIASRLGLKREGIEVSLHTRALNFYVPIFAKSPAERPAVMS